MSKLTPVVPCASCPIRHSAVCAECDSDELEMLSSIKSYRTIPAGAPLASAGESLTHFSSIVTGCATMSRTLEDGRRQTVGLLLPSDYIGRPGRARAAFDVEALSEVTLCRFERRAFEDLLRKTPHVASRLLKMTLDELDAARDWAVVLGRMTAREKVATFLISLARRQAAAGDALAGAVTMRLPLSREAIADHLGLTIETTSRQMTALRKDGLIEMTSNRDIRIPDFGALALEAGDDGDGGLIV
ncbi:transcriptional regulator FnrL [Citreimonas salinaria]|uniref:CRP/FNR family transcriptional regulator, anaerobic regulatory protein n=1 Tax=Citreimonas salinaria TaxID=321339 RepID=A0A1H3MSF2_9RHOB|nr:Crp/Fnr family transcriptional regulator [Citreimonas salinaria]SDY79637.1 CRP/FNR family transcriptional regulator, anaerobic regulatory protein [Citreimonas salinaria]